MASLHLPPPLKKIEGERVAVHRLLWVIKLMDLQTADLRSMSQIQRFIKNNWERVKQKIYLFIAERCLGSGCLINALSPKSD